MPKWLHRTTKVYLASVPEGELPEAAVNYIEEPDLSAVAGQPVKYWMITGDNVTLMNQAARDAVDAAELDVMRDTCAAHLDEVEDIMRAFALTVLDELNMHAARTNAILDAADNATSLVTFKSAVAAINDVPTRTIGQMKTALRNKLGS